MRDDRNSISVSVYQWRKFNNLEPSRYGYVNPRSSSICINSHIAPKSASTQTLSESIDLVDRRRILSSDTNLTISQMKRNSSHRWKNSDRSNNLPNIPAYNETNLKLIQSELQQISKLEQKSPNHDSCSKAVVPPCEKVETNGEDKQENIICDSYVDKKGTVRIQSVNKPVENVKKVFKKQSSFELPSIIQNWFSNSDKNSIRDKCAKPLSTITSYLPSKMCHENLKLFENEQSEPSRHRSFSFTRMRMEKNDKQAQNLSSNEKINNKIKTNSEETEVSILSNSKEEISENNINNKPKRKCEICMKQKQDQNIFPNEDKIGNIIKPNLSNRKGTLKSQGSLDSAPTNNLSKLVRAKRSFLFKSGSLDLEPNNDNIMINSVSTLSASQDSLKLETGEAPTLHRYYHVFKDKELDHLIENYVQNLHIISSYYDHANWCIIAEKVQVWTI